MCYERTREGEAGCRLNLRARQVNDARQIESPFTTNSGHQAAPELAMIMANQTAIMGQLAELKQHRLTLPAPIGNTFGPAEQAMMTARRVAALGLAPIRPASPHELVPRAPTEMMEIDECEEVRLWEWFLRGSGDPMIVLNPNHA
ncbi:unnamed protein product [Peronospora belbahrii]|uniref:Uncharacterized protein n=1 Tax=Peronospora belbahrii TaxID=622444 RepID=A0AAU9L2H0_9STRA|nr:unnamed protein product [Peronospora belbahrii]